MEWLISTWRKTFFIEPLLLLVLCFALVISIHKRKKYKLLNRLPIYIFSLLMVFVFGNLSDSKYPYVSIKLGEYIDYGFTIVELVIFSHLFYELITSRIFKRLIIFLNIAFSF